MENKNKNGNIYHIAIAVRNLDEAEQLYKDILGLKVVHREEVTEQGVRTVMLQPPSGQDIFIELLEPIDENSPVSKFLEKRGEGIHHICFHVDDIESTLKKLKNKKVRLVDETPRKGVHNYKVAFIHPKSLSGVLVELAEKNE